MYKFERNTRSELRAKLRASIDSLRSEVNNGFNRLANVITNTNEITIEHLGLRRNARDYL
jgi:carbon monoxide dehydrogenase subunit G